MDAELFTTAIKAALKPIIGEIMAEQLKPLAERIGRLEQQGNALDKLTTENLTSAIRAVVNNTPELTEQVTNRIIHGFGESFDRRVLESIENNAGVREAIDTYVIEPYVRHHDFSEDIEATIKKMDRGSNFAERVESVIDDYDFSGAVKNAIESNDEVQAEINNLIDVRVEEMDMDDKIRNVIKHNINFTIEVN